MLLGNTVWYIPMSANVLIVLLKFSRALLLYLWFIGSDIYKSDQNYTSNWGEAYDQKKKKIPKYKPSKCLSHLCVYSEIIIVHFGIFLRFLDVLSKTVKVI